MFTLVPLRELVDGLGGDRLTVLRFKEFYYGPTVTLEDGWWMEEARSPRTNFQKTHPMSEELRSINNAV